LTVFSFAFGKEWGAVEPDQFLFHHATHQIGGVDLVYSIAELAVETVRVEQRQEKLKICILAIERRGGHQEQVPNMRTELFGKAESACLVQFRPEIVCRELMGFIEHGQIPPRCAELLL
jgi:hypothetical protein